MHSAGLLSRKNIEFVNLSLSKPVSLHSGLFIPSCHSFFCHWPMLIWKGLASSSRHPSIYELNRREYEGILYDNGTFVFRLTPGNNEPQGLIVYSLA